LVIFQAKHLYNTWRGDKELAGTTYAVSENRWMSSNIFTEWLAHFNLFVRHSFLVKNHLLSTPNIFHLIYEFTDNFSQFLPGLQAGHQKVKSGHLPYNDPYYFFRGLCCSIEKIGRHRKLIFHICAFCRKSDLVQTDSFLVLGVEGVYTFLFESCKME
jgi:hypothetical protein